MWIHENFFLRAQQQPEHIAIVHHQEHLTYGELASLAEHVGRELLQMFTPGTRIAFCLTKSPLAIVMMLACLRAGMTYVPIDPKSPVERRHTILADCEAKLLLLDQYTAASEGNALAMIPSLEAIACPQAIPELPIKQLVWSDLLSTCAADSCRESRQGPLVEADTLAYLLYTSGSTGVPKGVMITHGNARAFVEWASATFDLTPDDHVAVHASLHFDLPVFDVYVGLAKGATLYLIDENTALFPEAFYLFLRDQAITVLYAVPSALIILTLRSSIRHQELQNLRYLLYAGEEYPPNHLRTLLDRLPNARIFNLYGPVETNVITQFEVKLEHLDLPHIPIGYPLFNTSLLLLDDNQQIVEEGEGEIVVSGPGVTPGYLNQPEQTQKAFCTVQVAEQTRTCYRTGDFAYRDHSGLLHFRGRRDSLIKTRGFRVELGDVEAALLRLPGVAEAAVVALPHPVYTNLMYAFVALQEALQVSESVILQGIREQLPSYMCPYQVFFRTQLPRTSTGKIARRPLQDELKALGK